MTDAAEVLEFWETAGPEKWYAKDDDFDQAIRDRFMSAWQAAHDGTLDDWAVDANGALGLIILLDQFPRNMFRDDPRAFATDAMGRDVAGKMLAQGWDREIEGTMRQFAYMPFMHSEEMAHQDIAVDLMETRMEEGNNDLHARVHREIIRRFGRFPYRNEALGRSTTEAEQAFLDDGGYGAILREMEDAA
ncbi:DUF924 family protein [Hasllibacter sp. MH4015]|uniref:DUF924 family protein n=1 Tax=Hasllibacter sp. MH4015 TaxID=2854029 RepID=UPI001CD7791F|nr:DUF924 family protein [Hasllibacter sp. MH4015]